MSLVRLSRLSDAPPPAREIVDVADDGSTTGWRSQHETVGRFAGSVPDLAALRALVAAAGVASPPSTDTFPQDATVDHLTAASTEVALSDKETPPGPWGELVVACRGLLDDVTASPVAAVALEVEGPGRLRLVHRGSEALPIRLETLWAEVTRWRDGAPVGSAEGSGFGLGSVDAGPGWEQEVAIDGGPAGDPGDLLTGSAWFVVSDRGVYVPVVVYGRATAS